jgi:hypothetical protein
MKSNELSIWAILVAASIVGSVVAAAIPNQKPKSASKQVDQVSESGSDETYTLVTTRTQRKRDTSNAGRFAAPKSF